MFYFVLFLNPNLYYLNVMHFMTKKKHTADRLSHRTLLTNTLLLILNVRENDKIMHFFQTFKDLLNYSRFFSISSVSFPN